jgi:hypothetical protein
MLLSSMPPCAALLPNPYSSTELRLLGLFAVLLRPQAYFDMSGGLVTFHGKARVPVPNIQDAEAILKNASQPDSSPVPINTLPG